MTIKYRSQSKLLIQGAHSMPMFIDMNRLTYQRHMAYCASHGFDYWHFLGHPCPEREDGGWDKVYYLRQALAQSYEFIVWLDTDTAIVTDADLSEALTPEQHIGGCVHDANGIDRHINVGALYLRNTEQTRQFVENWWNSYPGPKQWFEQGAFNELAKQCPGVVSEIDDKWNSTVNVNEAPQSWVKAWHGVQPAGLRLQMMREHLSGDWLRFRV